MEVTRAGSCKKGRTMSRTPVSGSARRRSPGRTRKSGPASRPTSRRGTPQGSGDQAPEQPVQGRKERGPHAGLERRLSGGVPVHAERPKPRRRGDHGQAPQEVQTGPPARDLRAPQ
eukprot:160946-Heterocapsa_arctica.AAC.1